MKRIALFLDGTSRATLIPFAPLLLGHLLQGNGSLGLQYYLTDTNVNADIDDLNGDDDGDESFEQNVLLPEALWSSITWATAGMIATYMIGRAAGTALGTHSAWIQYIFSSGRDRDTTRQRSRAYSRTVGAILALHLFCFGAGMHQPVSLYTVRFAMGLFVGLLLRMASSESSTFDDYCFRENESSLEGLIGTGVAKVWLAGFAISMLTSGVLYEPLSRSPLFVLLTGGTRPWEWIVATLFFLVMVFITENLFQFCGAHLMTLHGNDECGGSDEYEYDTLISGSSGGGSKHENASLVKRNVSKDRSSSSSPAPFKDRSTSSSVNSTHWNRPRLGSNNSQFARKSSNSSRSGGNHMHTHHHNRLRLDSNFSNRSNDIFFDCESQCDGYSVSWGLDEETGLADVPIASSNYPQKDHSLSIAKYENGRCVYDDGSPSPVQVGLCTSVTPKSFFAIHKSKADAKWKESKKWRIERRMWKIHSLQHSKYRQIKEAYPHRIHGFTKSGYPIMYERPGGMSLRKRFAEGSITVDDMIYHYTFLMEYFSNVACQFPECRERLDQRSVDDQVSRWGFFVVMDVTGFSLTVLSGDVLRYLQGAGVVNADHYPFSTARALVVNSPFWLSSAFNTIKSLLPDNTQVDLLSSSNQLEGMRKYIDDDQIPKEFGGSSPYALGEHPFEKRLEEIVDASEGVVDDGEADEYFAGDGPVQSGGDEAEKSTPTNIQVSMDSFEEFHDDGDASLDVDNRGEMSNLITPEFGMSPAENDFFYDGGDRSELSLRYGYKWENTKYHSEEYVFFMISAVHCIWCALQGSLETLLPVWLLSPQTLGGLAYEPRRSGFALFTASIVVLWLQRSKMAKCFVHIPTNSPLRGYRIGVGATAFLLPFLPFVPFISNFDNMLVLTTNILLGGSIFIASILGRLSLGRLHSIASSAYVEKISLRCDGRTKIGQTLNMIANFVQKGGFTYILGVSGEVVGSITVAPIIVWSAKPEHHFPLDTSFSFYTGASLCAILYMLSFSFKVTGETPNREFDHVQQGSTMRCSILRDVCAVSVSDIASLFEESNWSTKTSIGQHPIRSELDKNRKPMKKI